MCKFVVSINVFRPDPVRLLLPIIIIPLAQGTGRVRKIPQPRGMMVFLTPFFCHLPWPPRLVRQDGAREWRQGNDDSDEQKMRFMPLPPFPCPRIVGGNRFSAALTRTLVRRWREPGLLSAPPRLRVRIWPKHYDQHVGLCARIVRLRCCRKRFWLGRASVLQTPWGLT